MSNSGRHYTCFTSVFGDYEPVWDPYRPDENVNFLIVTDGSCGKGVWSLEQIDPEAHGTPRLANRYQKMRFQESLPRDGISVYIDANIRPVAPLSPLFDSFVKSKADIGLYRHYSRNSVRTEAEACLARGKVRDPKAVDDELRFYEGEGFPDLSGLWEGSIIFKRHDSEKLQLAMRDWWELYSRFQTRDQFSLPFIIWKHQLEVFDLEEEHSGVKKPFVHLQHAYSGWRHQLARYLQARAPENAVWNFSHKIARFLERI